MKARTKISVTLAVGIGLLIGSMGTASASPHYTCCWVKAPVSSYTEVERTAVPSKVNSENIRVTLKEAASPVHLDVGPENDEQPEISFKDVDLDSGTDLDMNDTTVGVSDIWTSGGTTNIWTNGSATRLYANFVPFSF